MHAEIFARSYLLIHAFIGGGRGWGRGYICGNLLGIVLQFSKYFFFFFCDHPTGDAGVPPVPQCAGDPPGCQRVSAKEWSFPSSLWGLHKEDGTAGDAADDDRRHFKRQRWGIVDFLSLGILHCGNVLFEKFQMGAQSLFICFLMFLLCFSPSLFLFFFFCDS